MGHKCQIVTHNPKPHPIEDTAYDTAHCTSVLTPSRVRERVRAAAARRSDRVRHLDGRLTAAMGGLDLIRTAHERSTLDDKPSTSGQHTTAHAQ